MPDKTDMNDFTSFTNKVFQYYSQTYLDAKKIKITHKDGKP